VCHFDDVLGLDRIQPAIEQLRADGWLMGDRQAREGGDRWLQVAMDTSTNFNANQ
jgi:hypothetical protein